MDKSKKKKEWVPKLSAVIRPDQYHDLKDCIPWGLRANIFQNISDDLIAILKSSLRERFLAAMIPKVGEDRKLKLEDFSKSVSDAIEEKK